MEIARPENVVNLWQVNIHIDSCDISEIRQAHEMGLIDGVALSQLSQQKCGRPIQELISEVKEVVGPILVEILGGTLQELLNKGEAVAGCAPSVVVQIMFSGVGLRAVKDFTQKGIKTHLARCLSASQALLAAKAGATSVSPFLGHVDDLSSQDLSIVKDIRLMYDSYGFKTEIMVCDVASSGQVVALAKAGCDGVTARMPVLKRLLTHPMSESGIGAFWENWEKARI